MGVISKTSFERTEVIGRGKFGVVYKGYNKQTKQVVAIKVLNLDTEEDEVIDVQQEIQFLTELKNVPNVTHYYGSFLNDTRLWIVMDYCAGGSLRTLLKCGVFEEKYIGVIMRELLIALQAVHKLGFIHRDLKAANVLITKEGNVRLCDFGVATQITSNALKRTTMAGTPYWMAPEVIREGDTYNAKADIWSLGITIYEIATGNPPYCDKDAMWAMQMISKLTPPRLEGREYSSALKETIALCLDENPEERPSAEDLLKCKFIKFYKGHPTVVLKEVITRYLLWRDRDSSRDSVAYMNLEENMMPTHRRSSENNEIENDQQLQVKWDFDSLSSRDYIIENDIDMEQVEENYQDSYAYNEEDAANETYQTQSTLQMGNTMNNTRSKFGMNTLNNESNFSSDRNKATGSATNSEIPKSLLNLFQEASPEMSAVPSTIGGQGFELPPSFTPSDQRLESPTIEIPDMDNYGGYADKSTTTNTGQPSLNKPPTLYHSQSASGNLETRFSTSASANRQRKLTISNTFGSNSSASHQPPRTPSSTTSSNMKTPSPKPVPTTTLLNAASMANTSSPSKSMKALQSNSNPLLQPINFKLTNESNGSSANGASNLGPTNNNINATNNTTNGNGNSNLGPSQSMNGNTNTSDTNINQLSSSHLQNAATAKPKRPRPGFHIQMPTPSNSINTLSALTHDFDPHNGNQLSQGENVNQFGINPSQIGNLPLTMTPVTEKENLTYPGTGSENTTDSEATNTSSNPRHHPVLLKKANTSSAVPTSNLPTTSNPSTINSFLPRTTSLSGSNVSREKSSQSFPHIPTINGEFFLDTTPKYKLVSELDVMIKLFNQGLETLENDI